MTASSFISVRTVDQRVYVGVIDPSSTDDLLVLRNGRAVTQRIPSDTILTTTVHRSPSV